MTALSGFAQTTAQSMNPATTTQSGLGKWFGAMSAIQALSTVGQGFAQNSQASADAAAQQRQADLVLQQTQAEMNQKARDVKRFAADQEVQYAGSGVTLEGSPALVIAETRRLGQQEIDAMKKRGQYQAQLMRTNAMRTKAAGRQALLGSITGAAMGGLQNYLQAKTSFASGGGGGTSKAIPFGPQLNINPAF